MLFKIFSRKTRKNVITFGNNQINTVKSASVLSLLSGTLDWKLIHFKPNMIEYTWSATV